MKPVGELLLEELYRKIRVEDGSSVQVIIRLIQELERAGLKGDSKTALELIKMGLALTSATDEEQRQIREIAVDYKLFYTEYFARCRWEGAPPPEIYPHPDHVVIDGDGVRICGPVTPEAHMFWEFLKIQICDAAIFMADSRDAVREDPSDDQARSSLERLRCQRRRLMRRVPEGWNWRERIWAANTDSDHVIQWIVSRTAERCHG